MSVSVFVSAPRPIFFTNFKSVKSRIFVLWLRVTHRRIFLRSSLWICCGTVRRFCDESQSNSYDCCERFDGNFCRLFAWTTRVSRSDINCTFGRSLNVVVVLRITVLSVQFLALYASDAMTYYELHSHGRRCQIDTTESAHGLIKITTTERISAYSGWRFTAGVAPKIFAGSRVFMR